MSSIESPYATPLSDVQVCKGEKPLFYVVSPRKFIILAATLGGWYWLYWFYKNWKCYREATGAQLSPGWRAFFGIFFLYSLVMKISRHLHAHDGTYQWWPRLLVLAVVVTFLASITCVWWLTPLNVLTLSACSLVVQGAALLQVQHAVNHLEGEPQGSSNARITGSNLLWIALGLCVWGVNIASVVYTPVA